MHKVTEADLPGVGVRFDLQTNAGRLCGCGRASVRPA